MRANHPYSYARCLTLTKQGSRRKQIANNTYVAQAWQPDGHFFFVLHNTAVVTLYQDGTYILKTDGWQTRTTMDRINMTFAYGHVYRRDGRWFLKVGDQDVYFTEGIRIEPNGDIVHVETQRKGYNGEMLLFTE